MRKVLVIDNHDSFVHNIIGLLRQFDDVFVERMYNDNIVFSHLNNFDTLLLSPGPGLPKQSNSLMKCIETCVNTHKILGVCLGHQAICEFYGAKLIQLPSIKHGHKASITKTDSNDKLLKKLPRVFEAALYNSWGVSGIDFPEELLVSSVDESGNIMSVYHKTLCIHGVQFHPESIVSNCGTTIVQSLLEL
ncbi:MAG TPA: aminodeoxychorismate/anthranilate synthase component II [Bacteroidales bacterium]|nr:aminodeoxychorismate/anthranilate synthase component II [Bacteroidales bacterium]HQP03655.1 aminodeoxychorismate/anthranilate synthase component II [Bacteroidales bacterium]